VKPKSKVQINGDYWQVYLLPDDRFSAEFGSGVAAVTCYNGKKKMLIFRDSDRSYDTIIHEVTHAYLSYQCFSSAGLKPNQMEEMFCDFMANNVQKIQRTSKSIQRILSK
jgi:hypothetical protein